MNNINNPTSRIFSRPILNSGLYASLLALILLSLMFSHTVFATDKKPYKPDLHKFWDKHCSECHGHSAEFSRTFLKVVDGELQGPLHKDSFRLFLNNHYLVKNQQDAIYDMLLAENTTEPRYKNECSSCHKKAAEFVRESLSLRDGELYSIKLDSQVSEYLESHRDLKAEDIEFFMTLLTRVADEVYRP